MGALYAKYTKGILGIYCIRSDNKLRMRQKQKPTLK